jgi:hypothetical protein
LLVFGIAALEIASLLSWAGQGENRENSSHLQDNYRPVPSVARRDGRLFSQPHRRREFPPPPKSKNGCSAPSGFLSPPLAYLFNAAVNASILVWAGRRSTFKGFAIWMQLLVLSFGAQVLMTQIETAYFISAFPLLHGNFAVYQIVLHGLVNSAVFTLLVRWIVGGFSKKPRPLQGHRLPQYYRQGESAMYLTMG